MYVETLENNLFIFYDVNFCIRMLKFQFALDEEPWQKTGHGEIVQ